MNPRPQALLIECELPPGFQPEPLEARIFALFDALGHTHSEVCITLVDDPAIQALNQQWRGIDAPTDVLSFPMEEEALLGDVIVSLDTAARMAASAQHRERVAQELGEARLGETWSLLDEITFLIVHGALHLLGHDHAEPREEALMRAEEGRLMSLFLSDRPTRPISD